jgi:putative PIN family toxin of toxin-antitoxin system
VLDTNVLVSGALTPEGKPATLLRLILSQKLTLCYDQRILTEYREVLSRPKFGFDKSLIADLLTGLTSEGLAVLAVPVKADLPDESDRPFLEVAETADAALITGNLKHFPDIARAISPAEFLDYP